MQNHLRDCENFPRAEFVNCAKLLDSEGYGVESEFLNSVSNGGLCGHAVELNYSSEEDYCHEVETNAIYLSKARAQEPLAAARSDHFEELSTEQLFSHLRVSMLTNTNLDEEAVGKEASNILGTEIQFTEDGFELPPEIEDAQFQQLMDLVKYNPCRLTELHIGGHSSVTDTHENLKKERLVACANLCKERGYPLVTNFLFDLANDTCEVFAVCLASRFHMHVSEYDYGFDGPEEIRFSLLQAQRDKDEFSVDILRHLNPFAAGMTLEEITSLRRSDFHSALRDLFGDDFNPDAAAPDSIASLFRTSDLTEVQKERLPRIFNQVDLYEILTAKLLI